MLFLIWTIQKHALRLALVFRMSKHRGISNDFLLGIALTQWSSGPYSSTHFVVVCLSDLIAWNIIEYKFFIPTTFFFLKLYVDVYKETRESVYDLWDKFIMLLSVLQQVTLILCIMATSF